MVSISFINNQSSILGYFVATSGNITDEMIMEYIKNQDNNEKEDGEITIVD
ncbi:hypothetical protein [Maribacter sp. ACAM166]|uniref:hypothetical protein n=1 Tax=Maribacter sp. ACAM166 TaxID=2508996 RepID=UPI0014853A54|nr:hypothetical protein [Maribacter sp. ACAM166]